MDRSHHLLPLRAQHVWVFVLVASVGAASLPYGRGRYLASLAVCIVGIIGFCLTMVKRPQDNLGTPPRRPVATPTNPLVQPAPIPWPTATSKSVGHPSPSDGAQLTLAPQTRLSGPVNAVDMAELMALLGDQVSGGDGHGVQLWATPVADDGLDVEFIDASGAYTRVRLNAEDLGRDRF